MVDIDENRRFEGEVMDSQSEGSFDSKRISVADLKKRYKKVKESEFYEAPEDRLEKREKNGKTGPKPKFNFDLEFKNLAE